jgi:phosphoketolase
VEGHGYRPVILEKRATSLYQAVAMVTDRAFEIIQRALTKDRKKIRHQRRQWKSHQRWKQKMLWD